MMAIASCVIGGVMLSGGIGNAIGAVFGALFLGLVTNIVLMYIKNPFYQNFYSGLIILFGVVGAVVINTTIQKKL
jgi:ribose/xylose/arabinose/galactoside ABC-type transport system permease subunit